MRPTSISVTEAARNFADCINRVHYQSASFILVKNGLPVARLVPAENERRKGAELAAALSHVSLAPAEAAAWSRDLRTARKSLRKPASRWK